MTPEKQRIAIVEECGYSRQEPDSSWFDSPNEGQIYVEDLPDYLNDLNAMHEAEKAFRFVQWVAYGIHLKTVCDRSITWPCHATAAQRAEAFLRTVGRWEE